jgi:hypothetical protein
LPDKIRKHENPFQLLIDQIRLEKLLEVLLKGIEFLPKNTKLYKMVGSPYGKLGISYRGAEVFAKSLALNPNKGGTCRGWIINRN